MKNDFVKGIQFMRFSMSKYTNVIMMIVFFFLGLAMELMESTGVVPRDMGGYFPIGIGAIFMICAAMFPSQMIVSLTVCTMAQASPYKKKLQTSVFTVFLLVSSLVIFTLIVVIRCAGAVLQPELSMEELDFLPVGVFAAFIILYSGVVYKFFIVSVILLWLTMMGIGGFYGFMIGAGDDVLRLQGLAGVGPVMSIAASYLLILVSAGLEYLISVALYRFPLSKFALRCSQGVV